MSRRRECRTAPVAPRLESGNHTSAACDGYLTGRGLRAGSNELFATVQGVKHIYTSVQDGVSTTTLTS